MAEKEKGSSVFMVEKDSSNVTGKPYRPNEILEDTTSDIHQKRSKARPPALPSVTDLKADIEDNDDATEEPENENETQDPKRDESQLETITLANMEMRPLKDVPEQKVVTPVASSKAKPLPNLDVDKEATKDEEDADSITDDLSDLNCDLSKAKHEWLDDDDAGGLSSMPRNESRASRLSRAVRQWFCCGFMVEAPSDEDLDYDDEQKHGGDKTQENIVKTIEPVPSSRNRKSKECVNCKHINPRLDISPEDELRVIGQSIINDYDRNKDKMQEDIVKTIQLVPLSCSRKSKGHVKCEYINARLDINLKGELKDTDKSNNNKYEPEEHIEETIELVPSFRNMKSKECVDISPEDEPKDTNKSNNNNRFKNNSKENSEKRLEPIPSSRNRKCKECVNCEYTNPQLDISLEDELNNNKDKTEENSEKTIEPVPSSRNRKSKESLVTCEFINARIDISTEDELKVIDQSNNTPGSSNQKTISWTDNDYLKMVGFPTETTDSKSENALNRTASIGPCYRPAAASGMPSGITLCLPKKSPRSSINVQTTSPKLSGINITISKCTRSPSSRSSSFPKDKGDAINIDDKEDPILGYMDKLILSFKGKFCCFKSKMINFWNA